MTWQETAKGHTFNRWWIALWVVNTLALLGYFASGASPLAWTTAALVLFLLPEMIGVRVRGDSLPPLTYAVRRYVKRWIPDAATWGLAGWMAYAWCLPHWDGTAWLPPQAEHPLLVFSLILGVAGWLTNHWDVTYDGAGE